MGGDSRSGIQVLFRDVGDAERDTAVCLAGVGAAGRRALVVWGTPHLEVFEFGRTLSIVRINSISDCNIAGRIH